MKIIHTVAETKPNNFRKLPKYMVDAAPVNKAKAEPTIIGTRMLFNKNLNILINIFMRLQVYGQTQDCVRSYFMLV